MICQRLSWTNPENAPVAVPREAAPQNRSKSVKGHLRRLGDARATPGLPPIAAEKRTIPARLGPLKPTEQDVIHSGAHRERQRTKGY
jgi:hypothetical protein